MKYTLLIFSLIVSSFVFAQTEEELKAQLAEKKDAIAALEGEAGAIQAQLDALPGWKKGMFGTIGGSISQFSDWYLQGTPNLNSGNIGITGNAFANLKQEKFFWNNALNINLGWLQLDNTDVDTDDTDFNATSDIFNLSSLYGYKLSDKWALSALGEYRTSILDNFNDPGYLDLGVGATWTPINNLVVVLHPLNYNFIFTENDAAFTSSLGMKFVADYTRQIGKVNFKSNLSGFYSYEDGNYSNWTWTNGFAYTLWKGIGLGFDFGLRGNKQEALNYALGTFAEDTPIEDLPNLDNVDNKLQSYWTLGASYSF